MLGLFKTRWELLIGAALALASLVFVLRGDAARNSAARLVGSVTAPVQKLISMAGNGIGSVIDHYVLIVESEEEVDRLNEEIAKLKREILVINEAALENKRLKSLLDFSESLDFEKVVAGKVIGHSASPWARTILLNKGEADGISKDSAVMTPGGVVGRIYETSPNASRALLITDVNSAVDALVQNTRAQVLVEGTLEATCRVLYLARGEEIKTGDKIITSGLGTVFPKGLLLGVVSEIETAPGEVFQRVKLTPSADLLRLEEVLVIPKQQEPTQQEPTQQEPAQP